MSSKILSSVLFLIVGQVFAEQLYPFVDQNKITDIQAHGHLVYFTTTNGKKDFDLVKQKWSYNDEVPPVPTPNPLKPDTSGGWMPWVGDPNSKVPPGYQMGEEKIVIYLNRAKGVTWVLVQGHDGEGHHYPESLVNLEEGNFFDLRTNSSIGDFSRFVIRKDVAWLGGPEGILSLDLKTGNMVSYITYPHFPVLRTVQVREKNYYLSPLGLFQVNEGKVIITKAMSSNVPGSFCNILVDGSTLYLLTSKTLVAYDTEKDTMETFPFHLRYVDQLVKMADHIIGYGAEVVGFEGSGHGCYGGAFSFSPKTKTLKVLTNIPVTHLNPVKLTARAEESGENDDSPLNITYYKYSPEKDEFLIQLRKGPIHDEELLKAYYDSFEDKTKEANAVALKRNQELSALKVQYQTTPEDEGTAEKGTLVEP